MPDDLISDLKKLFGFINKSRKKSKRLGKAKSWINEQMHK